MKRRTLLKIEEKEVGKGIFTLTYMEDYPIQREGKVVWPSLNMLHPKKGPMMASDGDDTWELTLTNEEIVITSEERSKLLNGAPWNHIKTIMGQELLLPPDPRKMR